MSSVAEKHKHLLKVAENQFLDIDYLDEELDDDFFYEQGERFRNDTTVQVCSKPIIIGDQVSGLYHAFNYDTNTISAGNSHVDKFKYEIILDFEVTSPVLPWYEKYLAGSDAPFPFVEVANPRIPDTGLGGAKSYSVQRTLMDAGCVLVNPSWGELEQCGDYGAFASQVPHNQNELALDVNSQDVLFFSYRDYIKELGDGTARAIGMQFNPHHPMSVHRLQSYTKSEFVTQGYYKFGVKVLPFKYDLRDRRYRLHSDVWISILGLSPGLGECYDLVGNFDFVADLGLQGDIYKDNLESMKNHQAEKSMPAIVEPLFISPYITRRKPLGLYSCIGPWEYDIHCGSGSKFFVPYITRELEYSPEALVYPYLEVTGITRFENKANTKKSKFAVLRVCDICALDVALGRAQCHRCQVVGYDYRHIGDGSEYFVKTSKSRLRENRSYRVFKRNKHGTYLFILYPAHVFSYPSNGPESIVYPFRFLTLEQAKDLSMKNVLHDYLPLGIYPSIRDQFSVVTFSKGEVNQDIIDSVVESLGPRTDVKFLYSSIISFYQTLLDACPYNVRYERKDQYLVFNGPKDAIKRFSSQFQDFVVN